MSTRGPVFFAVTLLLLAPVRAQEPPDRLEPGQSCTKNCHQEQLDGRFVHEPVRKGDCATCHVQRVANQHWFSDIKASCSQCHELELEANVHAPMTHGECTDCHDPHGGRTKSMLAADNERTLCAVCHAETVQKSAKDFAHGPAAAGACTLCHGAHSAPEPHLLVLEPVELCFKCHVNDMAEFTEADNQHAPVMLDCAPCHDPHGSDHRFMITEDTRTLCLGCHDDLRNTLESVGAWHGALQAEGGCLSCHDPHVSEHARLLTKPEREVCADCHSDPVARDGGPPVQAVSRRIAAAGFVHGPIREGRCSPCHEPHASAHPQLLDREYSQEFYVDYDPRAYAFCFECHDAAAFEAAKTTEATGFRDGDRNLHFLHVNRSKGRSCRACHEIHGADLPKLVAQEVPFGQWMLKIGFSPIESGGSCAPSCHKPVSYRRD